VETNYLSDLLVNHPPMFGPSKRGLTDHWVPILPPLPPSIPRSPQITLHCHYFTDPCLPFCPAWPSLTYPQALDHQFVKPLQRDPNDGHQHITGAFPFGSWFNDLPFEMGSKDLLRYAESSRTSVLAVPVSPHFIYSPIY
jgi:hypothetical protein